MSEALGVPLYRAGDTVPRLPARNETGEEEEEKRLSASVGPIRAALARRKPKVTLLDFERSTDAGCVNRGADEFGTK